MSEDQNANRNVERTHDTHEASDRNQSYQELSQTAFMLYPDKEFAYVLKFWVGQM